MTVVQYRHIRSDNNYDNYNSKNKNDNDNVGLAIRTYFPGSCDCNNRNVGDFTYLALRILIFKVPDI